MASPAGNQEDVLQKFKDALKHSFTNNGLDRDKAHELLTTLSELLAHVRVLQETVSTLKAELARRDSMYPPLRPMTDERVRFETLSDPHLSAEEFSKMVTEHCE